MRHLKWVSVVACALLSTGMGASAMGEQPAAAPEVNPQIVLPAVDAARGRELFINKGCVVCHAVSGVGGMAAPALDAPEGVENVDLLDFVARMWRGATAMAELQAIELGYFIELSGEEIGHLAAFASDPAAQQGLTIEDVPEPMRDWFLDEPYWVEQDWPEGMLNN